MTVIFWPAVSRPEFLTERLLDGKFDDPVSDSVPRPICYYFLESSPSTGISDDGLDRTFGSSLPSGRILQIPQDGRLSICLSFSTALDQLANVILNSRIPPRISIHRRPETQLLPGRNSPHNENPSLDALGKKSSKIYFKKTSKKIGKSKFLASQNPPKTLPKTLPKRLLNRILCSNARNVQKWYHYGTKTAFWPFSGLPKSSQNRFRNAFKIGFILDTLLEP